MHMHMHMHRHMHMHMHGMHMHMHVHVHVYVYAPSPPRSDHPSRLVAARTRRLVPWLALWMLALRLPRMRRAITAGAAPLRACVVAARTARRPSSSSPPARLVYFYELFAATMAAGPLPARYGFRWGAIFAPGSGSELDALPSRGVMTNVAVVAQGVRRVVKTQPRAERGRPRKGRVLWTDPDGYILIPHEYMCSQRILMRV